jgi:hypothetical protein
MAKRNSGDSSQGKRVKYMMMGVAVLGGPEAPAFIKKKERYKDAPLHGGGAASNIRDIMNTSIVALPTAYNFAKDTYKDASYVYKNRGKLYDKAEEKYGFQKKYGSAREYIKDKEERAEKFYKDKEERAKIFYNEKKESARGSIKNAKNYTEYAVNPVVNFAYNEAKRPQTNMDAERHPQKFKFAKGGYDYSQVKPEEKRKPRDKFVLGLIYPEKDKISDIKSNKKYYKHPSELKEQISDLLPHPYPPQKYESFGEKRRETKKGTGYIEKSNIEMTHETTVRYTPKKYSSLPPVFNFDLGLKPVKKVKMPELTSKVKSSKAKKRSKNNYGGIL